MFRLCLLLQNASHLLHPQGSVQHPRPFITLSLTFHQATGHLHTHAEHGLGHFNMLTLQKYLGVFREIQGYQ